MTFTAFALRFITPCSQTFKTWNREISLEEMNGSRKNGFTTSPILFVRWIIDGVRTKNLKATSLFVDFTKAFELIQNVKDRANATCISSFQKKLLQL